MEWSGAEWSREPGMEYYTYIILYVYYTRMSNKTESGKNEEANKIVLYVKKTKNATYPTKYGVKFQCVELIRRFFSIHKGITFPDVVDAADFFKRITAFTTIKGAETSVELQTFAYPYSNQASYYLRPGSILFWKYRKPDYIYGHVAFIWKNVPERNETYVVQQNLNPPIKIYKTDVLFSKMNSPASKFAGVKILPKQYLTGIQNLECAVHRL